MSVRAKFVVYAVEPPAEGTSGATQVRMGAVCRGIENSMWASATPSATLTMAIRTDAADQFVVGQEYSVLFEPAPKPAYGDGHPLIQAVHPSGTIVCEFCGTLLGYTQSYLEKYPHVRQQATVPIDENGMLVEQIENHNRVYGSPVPDAVEG